MPTYTITRGINVRRYFDATVEAKNPKQALKFGLVLLAPEHADKWAPSVYGHQTRDDLTEPPEGADETISVVRHDGEVMIDFLDVPNEHEPARYADLLKFAREVAAWGRQREGVRYDPDDEGVDRLITIARSIVTHEQEA